MKKKIAVLKGEQQLLLAAEWLKVSANGAAELLQTQASLDGKMWADLDGLQASEQPQSPGRVGNTALSLSPPQNSFHRSPLAPLPSPSPSACYLKSCSPWQLPTV